MTRSAEARIDLSALRHNFQRVRERAPGSRVLAVVKANGYGHGMVRIAQALPEADGFAVARLDEALSLRAAGVKQPIVLLEGFSSADELFAIGQFQLETVVHHEQQLALLEQQRAPHPIPVWLKIDTGMHRLGIAPERVAVIAERLQACVAVAQPLRYMTHYANADVRGDASIAAQSARFSAAVADRAGVRSAANSAAILSLPETHAEWVRPGIMLYGVSPFTDTRGPAEGLRPVMTLSAPVIAVNRHRKGDAIGYGGAWTCPEDMPVGVIAIGYADGYPRHAQSGTPVLIDGVRVPLIGRVSMDMITVDLRARPDTAIGDSAVVWGADLPVEEIADAAGTIGYQLLCAVSSRVGRVYSD